MQGRIGDTRMDMQPTVMAEDATGQLRPQLQMVRCGCSPVWIRGAMVSLQGVGQSLADWCEDRRLELGDLMNNVREWRHDDRRFAKWYTTLKNAYRRYLGRPSIVWKQSQTAGQQEID